MTTNNIDQIETSKGGLGEAMARIIALLLRPELKHWRPVMVLALGLTLAAKVATVVSPVFFGDAINAISGGALQAAFWPAMILAGLWTLTRLGGAIAPQLRDAIFAPAVLDAQRLASVGAFSHAHSLSLAFHQTRRTGALNRVIDRGVLAIDYLFRFLVFNIGPTLIELVLASVVLAMRYGPGFAVIAVVTVALYTWVTLALTEWRVLQRREMNEADSELRARAVDSLSNFETVKAFASEGREAARYDKAMKGYNSWSLVLTRSLSLLNAAQEVIMTMGLAAMVGYGIWLATQGRMQAGDLAAITLIMMNLYRPLNILGWAWREIKQGAVDLEKLFGLLDMKPTVKDAPDAPPLATGPGQIVFEHVSFAHDGRSAGLENISFKVEPGQKVGIVGPSGSGKSTLLKLFFRFYDVDEGAILLDEQDVRTVTQTSLREAMGLVSQDVVLFNDSIRENILYGRPDASQEALEAAARQADILGFIEGLPEGWNTRVGERGLKLSGGEKQRVGIARVILKNPRFLVLDEATSALDSVTEGRVQDALNAAARGRTTLVVAHRLSTISDADLIVVIEAGRVAQAGRHTDLLNQGGVYADMWDKQSRSGQDTLSIGAEHE
jgi:ATP-binding cassette subfamily B protein